MGPKELNHKPKTEKINWLKSSSIIVVVIISILGGIILGNTPKGREVFDTLQSKNKESTKSTTANKLDYSSIDELYGELEKKFDGNLDNQKLIDGMRDGLAKATGDDYTDFFTDEEFKQFNESLSGKFEGIGAILGKKEENIVVISPVKDSPAEKAGITAGDIIIKVDDKDTSGMSVDDVVKIIRGPKDTKVKLDLVKNNEAKTVEITRAEIVTPNIVDKKIGTDTVHIQVAQFSSDTSTKIEEVIKRSKADGVKYIILDLRGNPGGYLNEAVELSKLWLKDGQKIVEQKKGDKVTESFKSDSASPIAADMKTVILIDGGSASASEIVAGALHDNGVAKLVGVKSFGKGSVQAVEQLSSGGGVKITIAKWYTPNGINISKEGIKPDQETKLDPASVTADSDNQLIAAIESLK